MATVQQIQLTDDLGGKDQDVKTVVFGYEGKTLEIELNALNRSNFERSIKKYVEHAREVQVTPTSRRNGKAATGDKTAVREWAAKHGFQVGERGRIKQEVLDAYAKAHGNGTVAVSQN